MVLAFGAVSVGASCGHTALTLMPGVVNNPGNHSLRRALFGFAVSELCSEMKARSVPLKMQDEEPSIGRFFPNACKVDQLPDENLFVQFTGHGYAWTNVTGRIGFEASGSVQFAHDFFVDGSDMYVYFRQKQAQTTAFKPLMIERGDGGVVGSVAGLFGASVEAKTKQLGESVLRQQLARGFTVVRQRDGEVRFMLGVLEKGQKPTEPFGRGTSDWLILAMDRTELHAEQRDFVGPFTIANDDEALFLTAAVEGAAQVDALVVPRAQGDAWIAQYERYAEEGQPPAPPLVDDVLTATAAGHGAPPSAARRKLQLGVGSYYLVFDNTAVAGRSAPAATPLDDRAATVSYAVQLGERE
ncbi:MAG: hypothetical protein EXR75_10265 [Myxococcales bacterium]|nr:hypothetical protein [Myxococcales bacterium]